MLGKVRLVGYMQTFASGHSHSLISAAAQAQLLLLLQVMSKTEKDEIFGCDEF